ncbi:MAG: hypothetical protein ACFFDF_00100 [Candidatus Odinarchaeota archaeon]
MNVRVCFNCKQFTYILPEDSSNFQFLKLFDSWHTNHAVETIDLNELDDSYLCIDQNKRDKIIKEIKNILITSNSNNQYQIT